MVQREAEKSKLLLFETFVSFSVPLFYPTLFYPTLILPHLDFTPPLTLPDLLLYPTIYFTPPATIPRPILPHPIIHHPIWPEGLPKARDGHNVSPHVQF